MNNILESVTKDIKVLNDVIGFLHVITDEKAMIPLRLFPYFVLVRLKLSENGQLM